MKEIKQKNKIYYYISYMLDMRFVSVGIVNTGCASATGFDIQESFTSRSQWHRRILELGISHPDYFDIK